MDIIYRYENKNVRYTEYPIFNDVLQDQEKVFNLHDWQQEVSDIEYPYCLINSPCGAGKSLAQVVHSFADVERSNFTQKQLIIVPTTPIGEGFSKKIFNFYHKGRKVSWRISKDHDLCKNSSRGVIRRLKSFLLNPPDNRGCTNDEVVNLTCVATHHNLGTVWNELNEDQRFQATTNLTLRVDEAHRIKGARKGIVDPAVNRLGEICSFIFNNNPDLNAKICLSSATCWRTDGGFIVDDDIFNLEFIKSGISWKDYLQNFSGINNIHIRYEKYDDFSPFASIKQYIDKYPNRKHLIIVPSINRKFRRDNRVIIDEWYKSLSSNYRVLDLVNKTKQGSNKERLFRAGEEYDIIMACQMMNEGIDWQPCDFIHNTDCEESTKLALQRIGRGIRQYQGKTQLNIVYYLRNNWSGNTFKGACADHVGSLGIMMAVEDFFGGEEIVDVPALYNLKHRSNHQLRKKVPLSEACGGLEECEKIKKEIISRFDVSDRSIEVAREIVKDIVNDRFPDKDEKTIESLKIAFFNTIKRYSYNLVKDKKPSLSIQDFEANWNLHIQASPNSLICMSDLSPELLEKINRQDWEQRYYEAWSIVKVVGIENITRKDGCFLWLCNQKANFNKLSDDKKEKLEELGIHRFIPYALCVCKQRALKGSDFCNGCYQREKSQKLTQSLKERLADKFTENVAYNVAYKYNNANGEVKKDGVYHIFCDTVIDRPELIVLGEYIKKGMIKQIHLLDRNNDFSVIAEKWQVKKEILAPALMRKLAKILENGKFSEICPFLKEIGLTNTSKLFDNIHNVRNNMLIVEKIINGALSVKAFVEKHKVTLFDKSGKYLLGVQ